MTTAKISRIGQLVTALLAAGIILLCSMLLVQRVENSSLYRQGRFVGSVLSQESVGAGEILGNTKSIRMTVKFAAAVTSAYINFELIPVNEASTFVVIFESVNDGINVELFEYRRKNLVIDGYADTQEAFEAFLGNLRHRDYFDSVSGDSYLTTEDTVRFRIVCVSSAA